MSLDRIQSKAGVLSLVPEVGYTVDASVSSVATNQFPGGLNIGGVAGFVPANSSVGGGALFMNANVVRSAGVAPATTAPAEHYNAGIVIVNASTTGVFNVASPSYAGQLLIVHNKGSVTASVGTGVVTTTPNHTTTATVQNLAVATTIAASGCRAFVAVVNGLATATTNTPVWWVNVA